MLSSYKEGGDIFVFANSAIIIRKSEKILFCFKGIL